MSWPSEKVGEWRAGLGVQVGFKVRCVSVFSPRLFLRTCEVAREILFLRTLNREGNGTSLQYSCLENPMDGGAWWATVHEVAKSHT